MKKLFSFDVLKWFGNICFAVGTLQLVNPELAAHSIYPWVGYMLGNFIWLLDSIRTNDKPYMYMSFVWVVWNIVLILSRIYPETFGGFFTFVGNLF